MSRLSGRAGDSSSRTHSRARDLAALRLTERLTAEDEAWLEEHLVDCRACLAVAEAYESQRLALRRLPAPLPPRDLWARTAVALDRAEGRSRRGRLGRGLSPGLLGTLSAALVVAVVVGSSLLAGALGGPQVPSGTTASGVANGFPTPIPVVAAQVVWASHQDDGTYALNVAPVDRVCRTGTEAACAPIDSSARKIVALTFRPEAVVVSQVRPEAVVVGPRDDGHATSVFVVSLPAGSQGTSPAPGTASASPTFTSATVSSPSPTPVSPTPTRSAPRTPTARVSSGPSSGATSGSTPSIIASTVKSPAATSPIPSPAATVAILDDVVLASDTAAYSPDGTWFAFSARPADGSAGPDIYVWRVGEPRATAVTSDHSSVFSAWLGDKLLGSDMLAESPEPTASATTQATPNGSPGSSAGASASDGTSGDPSGPGDATMIPHSFAIDPTTGQQEAIGDGMWLPAVDPTGTLVVYWRGTLAYDPSTSSWGPAHGDLYLAPWSTIAPADLVPSPAPSGSTPPSRSEAPSVAPSATSVQPTGAPVAPSPTSNKGVRPGNGRSGNSGSNGRRSATLAPSIVPTPPPSTHVSASPVPSAAAAGSGESGGSGASSSPSGSLSAVLPQLLSPDSPPTGLGPTSWDIQWDSTGTRLAIWVGDPVDPTVGRLSLLTIDPATAQVDPTNTLLAAVGALMGFSMDVDRLVWVTPPGQNGEGSQLMVLAWRGADAGKIRGLPIPGADQLVVAR